MIILLNVGNLLLYQKAAVCWANSLWKAPAGLFFSYGFFVVSMCRSDVFSSYNLDHNASRKTDQDMMGRGVMGSPHAHSLPPLPVMDRVKSSHLANR
jgi:hypothetical protein